MKIYNISKKYRSLHQAKRHLHGTGSLHPYPCGKQNNRVFEYRRGSFPGEFQKPELVKSKINYESNGRVQQTTVRVCSRDKLVMTDEEGVCVGDGTQEFVGRIAAVLLGMKYRHKL